MSILTARLLELVSNDYPNISLPSSARFLPMYSLVHGEVSSTAAVEIAKITRQSAKVIADKLIAGLSSAIQAVWRNDNGYIVCSELPREVLLAEIPSGITEALSLIEPSPALHKHPEFCVWCLLPDRTEPVYARIRLLARAALQVLLMVAYGKRVSFRVSPLPEQQIESVDQALKVFRQGVDWIISHEGEDRNEVELPAAESRATIWTTHHYHERLTSKSLQSLASLRIEGKARVVMPADGWLLSRDRALSELLTARSLSKVIDRLDSSDRWARFLFHAASTMPSGDFDPAVALFDECSSPLWSVRVLQERYSRFSALLPIPVSREKMAKLIQGVEVYRKLVLSGVFMPLYTARAIVHNEIEAWCEAFERLASDGHAFINAPATRLALEHGLEDETIREIAAGLGFGLSCIVPVVMEGTCAEQ